MDIITFMKIIKVNAPCLPATLFHVIKRILTLQIKDKITEQSRHSDGATSIDGTVPDSLSNNFQKARMRLKFTRKVK